MHSVNTHIHEVLDSDVPEGVWTRLLSVSHTICIASRLAMKVGALEQTFIITCVATRCIS